MLTRVSRGWRLVELRVAERDLDRRLAAGYLERVGAQPLGSDTFAHAEVRWGADLFGQPSSALSGYRQRPNVY
jgi:hypothetical protein